MQCQDRLLLLALDGHRLDARLLYRRPDRPRVVRIVLVAAHEGPNHFRRQQPDLVAEFPDLHPAQRGADPLPALRNPVQMGTVSLLVFKDRLAGLAKSPLGFREGSVVRQIGDRDVRFLLRAPFRFLLQGVPSLPMALSE